MSVQPIRVRILFGCLATIALTPGWAEAQGSLQPETAPGPTMHSLEDVFKEVTSTMTPTQTRPHRDLVEGASFAHMYLTIDGRAVEGSCKAKDASGSITVVGLGHKLYRPINADATAAGVHVHRPFTVLKYVDKSTPLLVKALANHEPVTRAVIRFWRRTGAADENHYTVTLSKGYLVGLEWVGPDIERVSFTYQTIDWTWEEGGVSHSDDWSPPPATAGGTEGGPPPAAKTAASPSPSPRETP